MLSKRIRTNLPTRRLAPDIRGKKGGSYYDTIMSVLECPWSDEPMSWNARNRVKWLLSSCFRQDLTARRAREAEVRRLRLNIDARMFASWKPCGGCYLRTLIARAMTRVTVISDISDWASMVSLAHRDNGMTSVGLKAVALVNDRYR